MRHAFAAALAAGVLAGCGAAAQLNETPQQVVATATDKMSHLKSAKFDVSGTVLEQFPQAFVQGLGAQGAMLSNMSIDMSGKGQARFPDQASMSFQVKISGISVSSDLVMAGGKIYIKDPQTGAFTEASAANSLGQFTSQADPLSSAAILKTTQSIRDLGDTSLNGVAVHHYQITPDKEKLAAQASGAQAQALMRSMLQNGSVELEVWIGKDDHLLRRLKDHMDGMIDLNQALQAAGQPVPPFTLGGGSDVVTVANVTTDYHDFNGPVTVSVPPVASP